MNNCPKCKNIVDKFIPVGYINGDTLWHCDACNHKFFTDKDGKIKEDKYE